MGAIQVVARATRMREARRRAGWRSWETGKGAAGRVRWAAGPGPQAGWGASAAGPVERLPACVPLITVPHPHMARVRDRDHEDPRIWKDRSRIMGDISAGPRAAGALIDAIYQPCCARG